MILPSTVFCRDTCITKDTIIDNIILCQPRIVDSYLYKNPALFGEATIVLAYYMPLKEHMNIYIYILVFLSFNLLR